MKYTDIQRLQEAGLISQEQRDRIVAHFNLQEEGGKFLVILSCIGAVLIASGLVLLVAANWEEIPRGVKIATGLLLMLGAHGLGWYFREVRQNYPTTGEGLHLLGSALFLGNIALVGQVYQLSSRPPDAFLLWWAGIAALPWLLRSKAQHFLTLLALGLWFGFEANQPGSWAFLGDNEVQILLYALLGLIYLGAGYCLRRTPFHEFAAATEKLGLLAFLCFAYPLTWDLSGFRTSGPAIAQGIFPAMSLLALALITAGLKGERGLTPQWRWTWGAALAGGIGLLALALYCSPQDYAYQEAFRFWYPWVAAAGLFTFCLLQIQVGLQQHSSFAVNLGMAFIALVIMAAYLHLFGSKARTGLMFVISGVFLIGFGIYLDKKRRALVRQIRAASPSP